MKRIFRKTGAATLALAIIFLGFGFILTSDAQAQRRRQTVRRVNDRQVENIIRSIERRSDVFRRSFDAALDRSRLDGSYTEDSVNEFVKAFEDTTNDLRSRFYGRTAVASDVENVLNRAALIDQFMRTNLRQRRVQGDWTLLRGDLQRLATAYNVAFNWNGRILPPSVVAVQRAYRVNDSQVETLLRRVETKSDRFRTSLDRALDRSRLDNTNREDNINEFVVDFENSTDELRRKFDGRTSVDADVSNVLVRAARIDDFMRRNLRNNRVVQNNWTSLRTDLNLLSSYYSLAFNLDNRRSMPAYSIIGGAALTNADANFTGTYRLNAFQSDNARTVAGRATTRLNRTTRDRIFNNLVRRLTAPEMLAVQRQGMRVMLASTVSPQVTLDADGLLHNETYPNGRASNVRASFVGDTLTIVSNGDRTNDFTAIITALDNGRRMMVTRRVFAEGLNQAIEVKSYYDRTAEAAQFNIVNNNNSSMMNSRTNTNVVNSFYVADNTILVAALNTNLSTRTARDGDRFTMTVRSPSQYAGAIIEGYVSGANRSGRISGRSEMNLNYETIRWNNQTYRFAGITESVRTNGGENVRINNEGTVREGNSQTNQTIGSTAIGAGIGALLGAIIGGGQGAAIGAAVGAGTGAGSVYIQGRDDLELMNGAEFTIRASAPRAY
ncbi:MAG TPA: YMGG-like glycine zipper-containing protein [Pyrinomonadaceae bacterium]|nr:YMGG-like glycine zipper-containing protein [Pyrinomonadaceae bacterium]